MSHLTRTHFRHEADDKQRWFDAADACGMSLSEFIRAALDHVTSGTSLPKPRAGAAFTRMDPSALAQLMGACNNLNQAVHAGHVAGAMDIDRLTALAEAIVAIVRADLAKIAATSDGG